MSPSITFQFGLLFLNVWQAFLSNSFNANVLNPAFSKPSANPPAPANNSKPSNHIIPFFYNILKKTFFCQNFFDFISFFAILYLKEFIMSKEWQKELVNAIQEQDINQIKLIIKDNKYENFGFTDNKGKTILHFAVEKKNEKTLPVLQELLKLDFRFKCN